MTTDKLKIGIVLPSVPSYSETFFRSKIIGLQKAGFEVLLFVKYPPVRKNEFICPVVVHPRLNSNSFLRVFQSIFIILKTLIIAPEASVRLLKLERTEGLSLSGSLQSLVISSSILPFSLDWLHFGFATAGIKREIVGHAIGAKVAVSFRGYDISVVPIKNKKVYDKLWRNIDKVHTISTDLLQVAYRLGLNANTPVVKITPAISLDNFIKKEVGCQIEMDINFLTIGRLHWKKGLEYTLESLAIIKEKGYDFSFTIIGDGDQFERLKYASNQLNIAENVHFVGKVEHNKIPSYLHKNQIYIQYSIQEGFCNAVLEAQASGMLCIVSDAEGLQENVLHEKTGWVVPKRNPEALAERLMSVLKLSHTEKDKIRKNARYRVENEFSIEKQQKSFIDFYQNEQP